MINKFIVTICKNIYIYIQILNINKLKTEMILRIDDKQINRSNVLSYMVKPI